LTEPWDFEEANRLTSEAFAIESEYIDVQAWGERIDEAYMYARVCRDRQAQDCAGEESRRLAELCTRRAQLWEALAAGLDARDISVVRAKVEVIKQTAADQFRRRQV
jgi:hypothetical protein